MVAVTGSVGKTTTKDMVAAVLGEKFRVLKTDGNFNNNIGLPMTVLRLNRSHQVAVLEMGMNHFGEIDYLTRIARPDVAIITNIGDAHIENMGSRENTLKAKCEIFNGMTSLGKAVLNGDDPLLRTLDGQLEAVDHLVRRRGKLPLADHRPAGALAGPYGVPAPQSHRRVASGASPAWVRT